MGAPRPGRAGDLVSSVSCGVVRVDSHVLLRKVTSPGFGVPVGEPECGHDLNLRLLERVANRREVHVYAGAPLEYDLATHREVKLVERQFGATVTEGAPDPPPLRVTALNARLDQA